MENSLDEMVSWCEFEDGSFLQLEQIDCNGEITDTILMTREVALKLARKIREVFGNR